MRNIDATIAHLRWYFNDASADCEVPFLLGALAMTGDRLEIPDSSFAVEPITKQAKTRRRLLSLEQPHADVLAWMFEERDWHPRIRTLFSWPGVAVRTFAAQWSVAVDGRDDRYVWDLPYELPTGNHPSRAGVVGFLVGLKPGSEVVKQIRDETSRRVNAALRAYEAARAS